MPIEIGKSRILPNWLWIIGVFLVMNLLISGFGAYSMFSSEPTAPHWATETHPMMVARDNTIAKENSFSKYFINNWYRWDTGWYLKIASLGYAVDDHSTGFQPLYPVIIRALNALGINYLFAALLLSRISCLIALFLLFNITFDLYHSEEGARRTILFLLTFPAAFFLFIGYTEALYMALSLACIYFLRKQNWLLAGIAGGLAALARIQGIAIMIPMLWVALSGKLSNYFVFNVSSVKKAAKDRLRVILNCTLSDSVVIPLFSSFIPALAILGYSIYLKLAGFASITGSYSNWGTRVVMPWTGLWELLQRVVHKPLIITDYVESGLFMLFIVVFIIGIKELPIAFSLYNLSMLMIVLMRGYDDNFLPGFMRYMLIIFPVFIVMGKRIQKNWQFYTTVFISLGFNLLMTWAFENWFWVA